MNLSELTNNLRPGERYCAVQGEKGLIHAFFTYGTLDKSLMSAFFSKPEYEKKVEIPGKNLDLLQDNKPIHPKQLESRVVANRAYCKAYSAFGDLVIMSGTETEDGEFTFRLSIATTSEWELAKKIGELRFLTKGKRVPKQLENEMVDDSNMKYLIDSYAGRGLDDSLALFNNRIDDSAVEHKFVN